MHHKLNSGKREGGREFATCLVPPLHALNGRGVAAVETPNTSS
jgi:hypothetical protein